MCAPPARVSIPSVRKELEIETQRLGDRRVLVAAGS
jgi:hypothetical protein